MTTYADQRAHDVFWMTAEERNAYDHRSREVDLRVGIQGALRARDWPTFDLYADALAELRKGERGDED